MTVSIVPITEDHIQGFRDAVDSVARERLYLAFFEGFPLESSAQFVRENIAGKNPHFVAVSDDKVVGWCDVSRTARGNSAHVGVLGMGLLPPFRGKGFGKILMKSAIEATWAGDKFRRIELTVNESNLNAIALYQKMGFEIEGRKRKQVLIDGRYLDLLVMGLLHPDMVSDAP
jgi:RimJ/RimL family protein N-acetyltransferase